MTPTQPQFEEKRFALRMALRLPIVVFGRTDDGATWSEPTETDDISTLGALFQLNQPIAHGDSLYIRSHRPNGAPVEVKAQSCGSSQRATVRRASALLSKNQKRVGCVFLSHGSPTITSSMDSTDNPSVEIRLLCSNMNR